MIIRIGPRRFHVSYTEPGTYSWDAHLGSCGDGDIELHPDQEPSQMASTLIHEVIHALWATAGLGQRPKEETVCQRLEGPLLAFIVGNPEVITALYAAVLDGTPLPIEEN